MEQYIQFVMHHWLLWLALIIVLALIITTELRSRLTGIPKLSPQALTQMINRDNVVILDVRDRKAFDMGHIINAISFPNQQIESQWDKIIKYKNQPVVVVCNDGQTSPAIASKLKKQGFENVYYLSGGLMAWRQVGLPSVKE